MIRDLRPPGRVLLGGDTSSSRAAKMRLVHPDRPFVYDKLPARSFCGSSRLVMGKKRQRGTPHRESRVFS